MVLHIFSSCNPLFLSNIEQILCCVNCARFVLKQRACTFITWAIVVMKCKSVSVCITDTLTSPVFYFWTIVCSVFVIIIVRPDSKDSVSNIFSLCKARLSPSKDCKVTLTPNCWLMTSRNMCRHSRYTKYLLIAYLFVIVV